MIGDTRLTGPDGAELILLFDQAGLVAAEDAADKPIAAVIDGAFGGRLGYMAALLYGGLRRHHARYSLDDVHGIIGAARQGEAGIAGLLEGMMKAIEAAMPKRRAEDPLPAPENGTGTPSSEPGAKKGSSPTRSGGKPRAASPKR